MDNKQPIRGAATLAMGGALAALGVLLAAPPGVAASPTATDNNEARFKIALHEFSNIEKRLKAFENSRAVRRIFVTSTRHKGDVGGLKGADRICNARSREAKLPAAGNFMAWLSDSKESPKSRFVRSSVAYVLVDGTKVADDFADLADGSLDAPIVQDEKGHPLADGNTDVFTNTEPDGSAAGTGDSRHCDNWTTTSGNPGKGIAGSRDSDWTRSVISANCSRRLRFYCVEQ